jgi:hypothetical protein
MAEHESTATDLPTTGPASERWIEETLDKVFLTPRVVDERAFDELSASLKTLVKDAGTQSRALIATTGEVKLLGDQLREATKELQSRVETAAKVIPTLDQRVAKAEQLLDLTGKELASKVSELRDVAAKGVTLDRDRIEAQIKAQTAPILEQAVEEHTCRLRDHLADTAQHALANVDNQAAAMLARVQAAEASLNRTLEAAEARAQAITDQIEQIIAAGLDRVRHEAIETARRAAEEATAPLQRVTEALAIVEQAEPRIAAAQAAIESAVQDAGLRLGAAISEADRRAEAIGAQAATTLGELRQQAIEVVAITENAKPGDILAVVQDTVAAAQRSEAACRELRELVEAAERLTKLSGSLDAAGAGIESLTTRLTQLRADYEALSTQADGGFEAKISQMGAWLAQLLAQGDQIGRGLDRLIRQAGPMLNGPDPASA